MVGLLPHVPLHLRRAGLRRRRRRPSPSVDLSSCCYCCWGGSCLASHLASPGSSIDAPPRWATRYAVDFVSSGTGHRHCRQWLACFLLWSWILDAEPGAGKRKQVEFAMLPRLTHLDLQQHHQHQYKQHKQHSHADSRARGGAQRRPLAGRKLRHQPPLPRTLSSSWPRD